MTKTIHLISHTHWDREWYLSFQQFRYKLVYIIDHLMEILDSDPEFKYFLLDGQAIILEDYLEIRPERQADLARYIKDGHILIGPWYISPDEFLISPESHIRNLMEGDKICRGYGVKMLVGYLPDTFGHIGQMPQILNGFGIQNACFWRGLSDQPCEILWDAPDGSSVLLSYLRDSYSNAASLVTSDVDKFAQGISELSASLSPFCVSGQILLMHGTDHMVPPVDLGQTIQEYRNKPGHLNLIHSTLPQYFEATREAISSSGTQLPKLSGELRSSEHTPLLPNVLSTRIWIKQRNHHCEIDLLKWVEPMNAFSYLLDSQNSSNEKYGSFLDERLAERNAFIHHAWKLLMQCHPHDSICGTTIDQVPDEMRVRFDQVDQINHELIEQYLLQISDQIDSRFINHQESRQDQTQVVSSIIVFNPNDVMQTGILTQKLKFDNHISAFEIIDEHGNPIPYEQSGMGVRELITMNLNPKSLKQALGMIHEGHAAGFIIRDFKIEKQETQAIIQVTLSDQGEVDLNKWEKGIAYLEVLLADPNISQYLIHAISDPETDVSFVARDVPGHGYKCYWIRALTQVSPAQVGHIQLNPLVRALFPILSMITRIPIISNLIRASRRKVLFQSRVIENEFYRVQVHLADGTISVLDKHSGQLYSMLNRFVDGGDCGDVYNFCPPERDFEVTPKITGIQCYQEKINQKLVLTYKLLVPTGLSDRRKARSKKRVTNQIKSIITLVPGVPRIDIHTEVDNHAADHRLRVHFAAPFNTESALYDGHYEIISRPIGNSAYDDSWEEPPRPEVPQRQFTSITNGQLSLTIANRGLPEVEVYKNSDGKNEIALTLLRCIGWLSRDDLSTRKGHAAPMGFSTPKAQMLAKISFDYSIIPSDGNLRQCIRQAESFNTPLRSISTPIHPGNLPAKSAFIENQSPAFAITAIKLADDSRELIIRGFNSQSTPIDVKLKLWIPFKLVRLANLAENPIREIPIDHPGEISLHLEGHKILTILISY
jgi:mannosylglycerate hydrolase